MQQLFEGPDSLRSRSERIAFWLTALFALPAALLIGYLLHESIGASQVALFIVIAMIYVTLARGRLIGSSVRVHEGQYPRVFAIARRACAQLQIPMPLVFVREDNIVPAAALGFGEPYALVLSSHWIEVFRDDELAFVIGRELGHIAAGHTRFLSLLSVNGNENPLISLIFGGWLRRCATTCDRVGLLCCGSLDAAIRAIGVCAFHTFGRRVDYQAFADQQAEIASDSILRWGTLLGSEPYATVRIAALQQFVASPAYANAKALFERDRSEEPPPLPSAETTQIGPRDCAGWWRRFAAFSIDTIVVLAIITSFGGNVAPGVAHGSAARAAATTHGRAAQPSPSPSANDDVSVGPFVFTNPGVNVRVGDDEVPITSALLVLVNFLGFPFWFPVYLALLVVVAGQTFGMMIAGLRVVRTDFGRPGIAQTLGRYAIVLLVWWLIVPLSFVWRRILLHDRLTRTRVIKVERILARAAGFQ